MLPNFICVGAMKAGTTSYGTILSYHPDIFMPGNEVHFFDSDERYPQGLANYETSFTDWNGEKAIGEKTPTYSYREDVAGRIAEHMPDVKLIWLFREPVARAYSHYRFFISRGSENLTFDRAVRREEQGKTPDYTMNYIDRSRYVTQVERFLQYFPKEQMLFLLFEDFLNDTESVLQKSCEFLDVDPTFQFGTEIPRDNVSAMPRSIYLQWFGRQNIRPISTRLWNMWKEANRRRGKYPPMSPELHTKLSAHFDPYNEKLGEVTGLDLSVWHKKKGAIST